MYKWNKQEINLLINYLISLEHNLEEIEDDIELLYMLKRRDDKKGSLRQTIKYNLEEENDDYKELITYDNILFPLIDKYSEDNIPLPHYKKIKLSKNDILTFTRDNIKNINPKWLNELDKYFNFKNIDFQKNNPNCAVYLSYLNRVFVSLNKENTIADFYNPTHELLHVYYFLKNPKVYNHIENEFLSILGELITSYEMYNNNLFKEEVLKNNVESYYIFLDYLKSIILKRITIINNVESKNKINYLKNKLLISKQLIKSIYTTSLDYNYKYVISYVLALELFKLYLIDKEKCMYITEKLILSNDEFEKKLKDNNINLLENSDEYIKQLKKNIDF